jgi:hypothetical protein
VKTARRRAVDLVAAKDVAKGEFALPIVKPRPTNANAHSASRCTLLKTIKDADQLFAVSRQLSNMLIAMVRNYFTERTLITLAHQDMPSLLKLGTSEASGVALLSVARRAKTSVGCRDANQSIAAYLGL